MSIAFGVALLPALYMLYQRKAAASANVAARKERSSDLKANQQALMELRQEQERERKQVQEDERAYAKQLRADREAAAAEAAASGNSTSTSSPGEDWEVVRKTASSSGEDVAAAEGAEDSGSESDESDDDAPAKQRVSMKCQLCKKSFKSQAQMDNHEQSNQHKKAVQAASKAAGKKSRRDE
jgi:hypothetical protein